MESKEELNAQIKAVFDLCDSEKCGYISVNQLAELAQQYFGGGEQDVVQVIRSLDQDKRGIVSFEEFRNGVCTIMAMHRDRKDSVSSQTSETLDLMSNTLNWQSNSPKSLLEPSRAYSPLDTDNDSAIHSTSPALESDRGSSTVPSIDPVRDSMSDVEDQHYECYGEVSDNEIEGDLINLHGNRSNTLRPSRSSSFRSTASSNSSGGSNGNGNQSLMARSATLPFNGRNSWLRTSIRRSFGAGKRTPPTAQATGQLLLEANHNSSLTHSRQSSSCESADDGMFSGDLALEEDVIDLNERVQNLQQQVCVLADNQHSSDDKYTKVKQENAGLTSRILMLEEQLKEIEIKSEERLREEQKRTKEMMTKLEREKNLQIENYSMKLMSLEKEHFELRDELSRLRSLCDRLKEEKATIQNQLLDKETELTSLVEDHRSLQELSRREREDFNKERNSHALLLNELTKEIEELRKYKDESEQAARARSPSFYEYPSRYKELEADLKSLKQESQVLRDSNEELQAQLLNKSFQDGCQLLNAGADSSLADEFGECSNDQLVKALKDQQEVNAKLKSYIDGMLLSIMEHYPAILEVKSMF